MKKLAIFLIVFVVSCKSTVIEPEPINISGRYSSVTDQWAIILLLEQQGNRVESIMEKDGVSGNLSGIYDSKIIGDGQVILNGKIGFYNVHLDLFYSIKDNSLAGNIRFYSEWLDTYSLPVNFKFDNKLNKSIIHNQGGSNG